MITCSMPAETASSTAYWMTGLSTSGSISLGWALVAGRKRVPQPAAGKTALRTRMEPRTTRMRAMAGPGESASSDRTRSVYEGRARCSVGVSARSAPRVELPSGGSACRFVRLGSLAAALEQCGPGQHEHAAGDLHGPQELGEEDRGQRGAGHRLDQRDDGCPGGANGADPQQEQERWDRRTGDAGPDQDREALWRPEGQQRHVQRPGRERQQQEASPRAVSYTHL